jgi:hypothetical protein
MLLGDELVQDSLVDSDEPGKPKERPDGESSDFNRRTFVEEGVPRPNGSSVRTSGRSGRVWAVSSLKTCLVSEIFSSRLPVCVVAIERGSELKQIAFRCCGLKSIVIPSSVDVLITDSFVSCKSLESVVFESGSRLERIEESAFSWSGLKSIVIPSSVVVLGKKCFCSC